MNTYYLKKTFHIYRSGSHLSIGDPIQPQYFTTEYSEEIINKLQNLIKNGASEDEVRNDFLIKQLKNKDLLTTNQSYLQIESRKTLFFQHFSINFSNYEFLNNNILILGAGALGSTIVYLLAQFGFKNITIVDDDLVEKSDIEKTMIFRREDIGELKVNSIKKIIHSVFNVEINTIPEKITEINKIETLLLSTKPNFLIKACDPDLFFRVYINQLCFKYKIPYYNISYSYESVNNGPMYIPGFTCCDNSLNKMFQSKLGQDFNFYNHSKLFTDYTIHPSISFNINIASNIALKEIIFFLSGNLEYVKSLGQLAVFRPLYMDGAILKLKCESSCDVCN